MMSDSELLFRDKTVFTEQGLSCWPELTEPTNKQCSRGKHVEVRTGDAVGWLSRTRGMVGLQP